jgi:hypothetical protein
MPKSRPFTTEEADKISSWLSEHWTESRKCPISGHDTWDIPSKLVYLATSLPPELLFSQQLVVYPSVLLVCKGCGYTMFFNAINMGIEPPKDDLPTKDEEKKNG